jgi:putative cardiolipin synthase
MGQAPASGATPLRVMLRRSPRRRQPEATTHHRTTGTATRQRASTVSTARIVNARQLFLGLGVALAAAGCATLDLSVPRIESHAWPEPEATALGRALGDPSAAADGRSGFHLISSGMEAFALRAALAETAQRTLDLQYYAIHDDATGQLLLGRLLAAAKRGVRVRLLIDDLNVAGDERNLAMLAARPHFEVRAYNPFLRRGPLAFMRLLEYVSDSVRLNRRMHNKAWIADNAAAIVGGRNVGDEYFQAHADVNFADLDLLAAGPVVRGISRGFDEYWNSEWAVPIRAFVASPPTAEEIVSFERDLEARTEAFRDTEYARTLRDTRPALRLWSGSLPLVRASATVIYDEPGKASLGRADAGHPGFAPRMQPLMAAARREVILITPYFIPSDIVIGHLGALAARGVRVRILTNSLASTDVPFAHAAYARSRERLLSAGVELHETRADGRQAVSRSSGSGASLHAKAVVVDREHALVGSMNLDPRSRLHNTEMAVLVDSSELAASIGAFFDEAIRPAHAYRLVLSADDPPHIAWITEEGGAGVRHEREPPASWWRRFLADVLAVLVPEELL